MSTPLHRAQRILIYLGRFEIAVVVLTLGGICLLVGTSVALRYLFGISLVWAPEISLLMFQCMVFSGAAAVYKARAYITMDFLFKTLPVRVQPMLMLATWILASIFAGATFWQGLGRYSSQITTLTYILELPKFYYTVPLIYGAFSLLLTSIFYAWTSALYLFGGYGCTSGLASFENATRIVAGPRPER